MPNDVYAGVYSETRHYLAAIRDAGTVDGKTVIAKVREIPVNDASNKNGVLRLSR